MKKIILVILSIILGVFILQQLYYRIKYEGNLVFYISNESLVDFAHLEIYIDGNKVFEDSITNEFTHLYKPYPLKLTLGCHTAIIKMNGEISKEMKFNTFLATFITIDYYRDRFNLPRGEEIEPFSIDISKRPLYFIS